MSRRISVESILKTSRLRPDGYVEEVLSYGAIDGEFVVFDEAVYLQLLKKYRGYSGAKKEPEPAWTPGPGSWLKRTLWFCRIVATHGCKCNKMAKKMNEQGAWWCLAAGRPEIIATMAAEAEKRKLHFAPWRGNALIFASVALSLLEKSCSVFMRSRLRLRPSLAQQPTRTSPSKPSAT